MKSLNIRDRYEHQIRSGYDGSMRKMPTYEPRDMIFTDLEAERMWHASRVRKFYQHTIPVLEPEPEEQYEENPVEARARALGLKIQRPHKE